MCVSVHAHICVCQTHCAFSESQTFGYLISIGATRNLVKMKLSLNPGFTFSLEKAYLFGQIVLAVCPQSCILSRGIESLGSTYLFRNCGECKWVLVEKEPMPETG